MTTNSIADLQKEIGEVSGKISTLRKQLSPLEKEQKELNNKLLQLMLEYPINPNQNFDINGDISTLGLIERLGDNLGNRLIKVLEKEKIISVGDLLLYSFDQLLKVVSVGKGNIGLIIELLHEQGWTLGQSRETLEKYGYKK